MSFLILGNEPTYNYISDTYRWNFYNTFDLQQYQMCDGRVRYALMLNLRNEGVIFTTKQREITEDEFNELELIISKKLWFHFNDLSVKVNDTFETINQLLMENTNE